MHTSTLNNEKELLAKVAQGDETAFTRLFYAYHNKLGAYILRLTGSHEIAEEIVQDVFIKIWTKRETLLTIEHFDSYLYVLSRNHAFNCLRQLAKERSRKEKVIENIQEPYAIQDQTEISSDYYILLDEAVEKLPSQQQKAYILSRRERLKYEEIAQQMHLSKETVKKYLKLATRFIKNYVHNYEAERVSDKAT